MLEFRDKVIGCLMGAAIGDALGMPNEDLTLAQRDMYYGGALKDFVDPHEKTPCRFLRAGQYTDDTQLILAVSESLAESKGFSPDNLAQKLIEWLDQKDHVRYRGEATRQGIENLKKGVIWHQAGVDKAGCGSATRAIPFGLFFGPDESADLARRAGCMTHINELAKDGASCVAYMISNLMRGKVPSIMDLSQRAHTQDFKNKFYDIERCIERSCDFPLAIEVLGNRSLVHEVVGLALFIFLSNDSDFRSAVLAAANAVGKKRGDTDSIACLVGAMSGTYNGLRAIPLGWVQKVENSQYLMDVGQALIESILEHNKKESGGH